MSRRREDASVLAATRAGARTTGAAVLVGPRAFEWRRVPMPEPAPGQVRLRVEGCGVCASSLPVWEGREWFRYPCEPGAPGHEAWGVVDTVGEGVTAVAPGDRVAALSYHGFAEHDLAEATHLVRLPDAFAGRPWPGEPLGCVANVMARAGITRGHTVAIVGVGFLGALLVQLAVARGARVVVLSRRPFALELGRRSGAAAAVAMTDHAQTLAEAQRLSEGRGYDVVVETAGHQWPLDLAAELTATRGRLVVAGYHQDGPRQVNMQLWNWRGIDVINAHEREPAAYVAGMQGAIDATLAGELDPWPLFTHRWRLSEAAAAMQALERREDGFVKALLVAEDR